MEKINTTDVEYDDSDMISEERVGCLRGIASMVVITSAIMFILKFTGACKLDVVDCLIPFLVVSIPLFIVGFISMIVEIVRDSVHR